MKKNCGEEKLDHRILILLKNTTPGYLESKFHRYLCDEIEKFMDKKGTPSFDILLLSVPPQFGKSITVTKRLATWYMLKRARTRVIIGSYNEDFAIEFGRANKETIEFCATTGVSDVKLSDKISRNVEFETTNGGRCISRGIFSGITGNPADLIIIDDPIKKQTGS